VTLDLICGFGTIKVWQRKIKGSSWRAHCELACRSLHRSPSKRKGQSQVADILQRFGIVRIINATGPVTRLGASPLDQEVLIAMAAAAQCSVDMAELQSRASEMIAQCTGAEAGIVTSGAMAGLLVGAAACMAGLDPAKMSSRAVTATPTITACALRELV
jgi:hypothetical protein